MKYRSVKNAEITAKYWGKSLDKPDWYRIENSSDNSSAEIILYDVIGWPYNDATSLVKEISRSTASKITVKINSPGGDVFDGLAIFNALKESKAQVTTKIEGLAASMASVIALAGNEITANKNAMIMIHEPWTVAAGNQHMFRDVADLLEKISGNLLDIYYQKSGGKRELQQMMKDETWFTAQEAKTRGLIDSIIETPAAKSSFDLSMFARAPDGFNPEGRELNEREIERALRDAGASRSFAKAMVAGNYKVLRDAELLDDAKKLLKTFRG